MGLTLERIWDALIAARAHDWHAEPVWRRRLSGGELSLDQSGRWQVAEGLFDERAHTLLDTLAPLLPPRRLAIAQLGQSLDGRIATQSGHSHYINGPVARAHLHRLRALVDAVVIGAGTALADRPRLSVRQVAGPDPVRVIIDPRGRVPASGPLFEPGDAVAPVLHLIATGVEPEPAPAHVERLRLDLAGGGFAPAAILDALAERGLGRVLVEGGADTVSRFVDAGALDRLHLLIAPLIIGSGRSGLELPVIDRLDQARRPPFRHFPLGDELLIDVELRSVSR